MALWKRLFGGASGTADDDKIRVNVIAPGGAPFEVATRDVEVCFLGVPADVLQAAHGVKWHDLLPKLLGDLEPVLWKKVSTRVKTVAFGVEGQIDARGFAGGDLSRAIFDAVESQGAQPRSSIYVRIPQVNVDPPGRLTTLAVGFAFSSKPQKVVISASSSCVPLGG